MKKKIIALSLILLLPSVAWAADQTYYIREDKTHNATRDGLTYATAWGAEADGSWTEVVWGAGDSAVSAGDTLMVYGAHVLTVDLSFGASGATLGSETTIDFTSSTITFAASKSLQTSRSYYKIKGLTETCYAGKSCIYQTAKNIEYDTIDISGGSVGIRLEATAADLGTLVLKNSNIHNLSTTGLYWLAIDAITSVIDSVEVTDTAFSDITLNGIELRSESDAPNAYLGSFKATGCSFDTMTLGIAVANAGTETTYGWGIVDINDNDFNNLGGAVVIRGFGAETYGVNKANNNRVTNTTGATGGFNIFWNHHLSVFGNHISDGVTDTIDGNGILVDFGNDHIRVYENEINRMLGKTGVDNSGCALMVLDSTNVEEYNNYGTGNKTGLYANDLDTNPVLSPYNVFWMNNTFTGNIDYGILIRPGIDNIEAAGITAENNILTSDGTGYAVYDVSTGGGDIIEDYNLFYGFDGGFSGHTTGAHDSLVDPRIDSRGRPTGRSPEVVKSGGLPVDGKLGNYDGSQFIGAVGWSKGSPEIPGLIMTKIFPGPLALGKGKIYVPVVLHIYNADIIPDDYIIPDSTLMGGDIYGSLVPAGTVMDATYCLLDGEYYLTDAE